MNINHIYRACFTMKHIFIDSMSFLEIEEPIARLLEIRVSHFKSIFFSFLQNIIIHEHCMLDTHICETTRIVYFPVQESWMLWNFFPQAWTRWFHLVDSLLFPTSFLWTSWWSSNDRVHPPAWIVFWFNLQFQNGSICSLPSVWFQPIFVS